MFLTDLVLAAAARTPEATALASDGQHVSWRAFAERIARLAGALRAQGIARGERVAVLATNTADLLALQYAVMWSGSVLVPLNTRLAPRELAFIVGDCAPVAFVFDARLSAVAAQVLAEAPVRHPLALESFCASATTAAPIAPAPDPLAGIFYTGGTTGLPKGVMLSHAAQCVQARNIMASMQLDARTVFLHAMPLFHVAGAASAHATTAAGGSHAFLPVFEPGAFYATCRTEGVDALALAPTMFAAILDAPARDDRVLAGVRTLCYGAAPITQALLERMLAAFPSGRIAQYYGQTEVAGGCLALPPESHVTAGPHAGKLHTAGRAMPGFEVRVVDAHARDCAPGTPGEVIVRGDALMDGYWRAPDRTALAIRDGWLHTGDVGVLDADGFIAIVDRLKDMIVTGGENVYSSEVENALAAHPDVAACAVVGLPDPRWGEAVHAIVVPRAGRTPVAADLLAFCKSRIAGYKCPKSITFRTTPLPLSGVGKVQKNLLRDELAAHRKDP